MNWSGRKQQRGASGTLVLVVVVIALIAAVGFVRVSQEGRGPLGRSGTGQNGDPTSAALDSIGQYWEQEFPAVFGSDFVPLRGGFQPKTPESPAFSCGGQQQGYEALQGNAFYCGGPEDDYIAWDAAELFPRLTSE